MNRRILCVALLLALAPAAPAGWWPRPTASAEPPKPDAVRRAVAKSLPLLQQTGPTWMEGAPGACASCHHQSVTAATVGLAREKGFEVDEKIAADMARATVTHLTRLKRGDRVFLPDPPTLGGYMLLGMDAEKHAPDELTFAIIRTIADLQRKDGHWSSPGRRPPSEGSDFTATALVVRGLRAYGTKETKYEFDQRADKAREWLLAATPRDNEDRTFQLLGAKWSGAEAADLERLRQALLAEQRPDGGWSQLASGDSDAYATGEALVALHTGGLATTDPGYVRGLNWLLASQLDDGSWHVKTRSRPIQRYFETGFPHGKDQFISCAATAWATQALLHAVEAKR